MVHLELNYWPEVVVSLDKNLSVWGGGGFLTSADSFTVKWVLAMIPLRCVLTSDSLGENGKTSHNEVSGGAVKPKSRLSWLAYLMASALRDILLPPSSAANEVDWSTWICSWTGGGDSPSRRPKFYRQDNLGHLVQLAGLYPYVVLEAINARFALYVCHFDHILVNFAPLLDINGMPSKIKEYATALCVVKLSHSENLVPTWYYTRGVIPLHEIINHLPPRTGFNMEIFCTVISNHFHPPIMRQGSGERNRRTVTGEEQSQIIVPLWSIRTLS